MAETKKVKATVKAVAPKENKSTEVMNPPAVTEGTNKDVYSKEMVTELTKRTKTIKDSIGKIDTSFEKIAFALYWISSNNAYKAKGCDNIVTFAKNEFGYEKTTCYSLLSVVESFAKREDGKIIECFRDDVKGYSVSKLSLMVGLSEEDIKNLSPTMTVKDIKKYVKSLNGKALPELSEGNADAEDEVVVDEDIIDMASEDVKTKYCTFVYDSGGKQIYKPFIGIINDAYIADMLRINPGSYVEIHPYDSSRLVL